MLFRLMGRRLRTGLRLLARDRFGLEIARIPEKRADVWYYEMNEKLTRRFLHFESVLRVLEDVDGCIVECGVGPGRSIFAFAIISQYLTRPRDIIGFDTFEGIPPPTAADGVENAHKTGWWRHSIDNVDDLLKHNGLAESFIAEKVSFVPGLFEDTLPSYDGAPIALLHLDVDFYESYKTALRELWPHVAPGGIVAFDEYGKSVWPGATRAVDEFFCEHEESPVESDVADYYYVVKRREV